MYLAIHVRSYMQCKSEKIETNPFTRVITTQVPGGKMILEQKFRIWAERKI
jgi:hypothetical protein